MKGVGLERAYCMFQTKRRSSDAILGKATSVLSNAIRVLRRLPRLCVGPAMVVRFFNSACKLETLRTPRADLSVVKRMLLAVEM